MPAEPAAPAAVATEPRRRLDPRLGLLLLAQPAALGVAAELVLACDQLLDAVLDGLVGIGHG